LPPPWPARAWCCRGRSWMAPACTG
jgi:hypothetical protein